MRLADVRGFVGEARGLGLALRDELSLEPAGPIVVSGVLAEQLAKELAAGAAPGAVLVGPPSAEPSASVHVHIVAGDPSAEDESLVREATGHGIDVVIVELWPQADWTRPFVLSPFVVECRAGEGFPLREIADRIVEAAADATDLASSVPTLAEAIRSALVKRAVVRSALIGLVGSRLGASRPLLVREQVRTVAKLRRVSSSAAISEELPTAGGAAAAVFASGLVLRGVARRLRGALPGSPLAHAAIAAGGTWAVAKAYQALESHLPGE